MCFNEGEITIARSRNRYSFARYEITICCIKMVVSRIKMALHSKPIDNLDGHRRQGASAAAAVEHVRIYAGSPHRRLAAKNITICGDHRRCPNGRRDQ
mmetsp:Transcript_3158/g.6610  ORF Transcript_3158/g.6610 Transcript_3158/m.6610 type:complete len:98 (+) Transcript_3158:406-699(+)